jgi:NitT/TauT family transport system ATP-binding protein
MTEVAIAVRGVDKVFNPGRRGEVTALRGIDLAVAPRELLSLIGPSGCGKSTLLRVIGDLETPSTGSIEVNGKAARQARLDHDYGMVFQQAGLFDWRTVAANVELPLELLGWDSARRKERSRELLELVHLEDFAGHRPWELSGGMQQRVAIARALAMKPGILLMDEPFGALDEMTREHMQAELVQIQAETGATVVFVTHSIPEAVFLSNRVVVMSRRPGRIAEVVDVDLGERGEATRADDRFFATVTAVRAALRGSGAPAGSESGMEVGVE